MSGHFVIKDRHGNDLHFGNGGEVWFPAFPHIVDFREQLKKIGEAEIRDDDVFLGSFARSGTNWHLQILHMLLKNNVDYEGSLLEDFVDWTPPEQWNSPPNRRLLSSHLTFKHLPRQIREKKNKVIYAYRNPKDVWVSFYNMMTQHKFLPSFDGTWSHFFDDFLEFGCWYGGWFDHVLSWEKAAEEYPGMIFMSNYEDMKKDPVGQIMKIDQFLGLNRGKDRCEEIAKACEFSKLKKQKEQQLEDLGEKGELFQEGTDGLFRKGEIGDWKNWFTVAQNERFDAEFNKRMKDSQLKFTFQ